MQLLSEINQLKNKLLKSISENAQNGNTEETVKFSKILQELNEIESSYDYIEKKFINLKKMHDNPTYDDSSNQTNQNTNHIWNNKNKNLSPKAKGKLKRQNFVKRAKEEGVTLYHKKSVKYFSQKNDLIGIATATERASNRWFLGLPKDDYDCIVLICEDKKEITTTFILPRIFTSKYNDMFSYDKKNQIKLNIIKSNNQFYISMPEVENIEITKWIDDFSNL
ncbi:MAG: hypothetical protein ACLFQM_11490 [Fidelibacterota bacterium]